MGEAEDLPDGLRGDLLPLLLNRVADSPGGVGFRERADDGELKQPLGVGFRLADKTRQDGQTGADEQQGKPPLLHAVHGHDQGAEFPLAEILDFVD